MSGIKSYKELFIWQKGIKIVVQVYKLTKSFPKEEIYALTSQLKGRAYPLLQILQKDLDAKPTNHLTIF